MPRGAYGVAPSHSTPPAPDLDLEAIDGLARAINNYQGGLVLVSHDFRLIDAVAKEIWVCDKKTVSVWKGDIREYKARGCDDEVLHQP